MAWHDYMPQLIAIAGEVNPVAQPTTGDWERCEREIGLTLPDDFKQMVSYFGDGVFGDDLNYLNPCPKSWRTFTVKKLREYHENRNSYTAPRMGMTLYPDSGGWLLGFGTSIGTDILFQTVGPSSRSGKVVLCDFDLEETREFDMSVTQFLYELFLNKINDDKVQEFRRCQWVYPDVPFFRTRPVYQSWFKKKN